MLIICIVIVRAFESDCVTKGLSFALSDVFNFTCPKTEETGKAIHPRYADPDDCQFFYVCINGEIPRRSGCSLGKVFNDATKSCDSVKNVPEWYEKYISNN